jgi:hypothetical protein
VTRAEDIRSSATRNLFFVVVFVKPGENVYLRWCSCLRSGTAEPVHTSAAPDLENKSKSCFRHSDVSTTFSPFF